MILRARVNALAKKSLVLLVHLVPVRNYRTLPVMVHVHLDSFAQKGLIKMMKTDVVENRQTPAQQHFIVNPEVKHLNKSTQTSILSVVLPIAKPKSVHPATL